MSHSRRTFLNNLVNLAAVTTITPAALAGRTVAPLTSLASLIPTAKVGAPSIKALAFDAFPIFDPRPVAALAETLFGVKGQELSNLWRLRQFEYQWLRALSGTYQDFWSVTNDALTFAANTLQVDLTEDYRRQLMDSYLHLKVWPDVLPALQSLKQKGLKLAFLSNMTEKMLKANIKINNLDDLFDEVLSTGQVHNYKPSPKAYQLAVDKLRLHPSEIGFVAFAGWDACGAKTFGYPTYWINRQGQIAEELGSTPDWTGRSLTELVSHLA